MTRLWQLLDSAFPSGGFAHSAGLEAAWHSGEVSTDAHLAAFLRDGLWHAGHSALPLVTTAYHEPARFEELDGVCDATLTNAVANRASRVQGRAWLAACSRVWPSGALSTLDATAKRGCGHCAPAMGAAVKSLDLPLDQAQRLFLFIGTRTLCSAAVKLGIVGPYRAQRLQHECLRDLDAVVERCQYLSIDQVSHTAPLIDLLQSTHDRLYSRLFQS